MLQYKIRQDSHERGYYLKVPCRIFLRKVLGLCLGKLVSVSSFVHCRRLIEQNQSQRVKC